MTLCHPLPDALVLLLAAAVIELIALIGLIGWALVRWINKRYDSMPYEPLYSPGDPSPERVEAAAVAYYAKWRELWKVSGMAYPVDWSGLQEHTREATRECAKAALLAAAKA